MEIMKLLLSDNLFDPAVNSNRAITITSNGKYNNIVDLLLNDKRVDLTHVLLLNE